jgi:hypothetical protein
VNIRSLLVESWGTAEWVALGVVIIVQTILITSLLATVARTALNLQALSSEDSAGDESIPFPQD